MQVLVTGGAGYIGSHACKALSKAGIQPISYDNLSNGHAQFVKWGPLERGDIRDSVRLSQVFGKYKIGCVLHFAGLIEAGRSVEEPDRFHDHNVNGTLALLDAMSRSGVDAMVFSSSCAVYGNPDQLPMPENHAVKPVSPYGSTKLACERLLADFAQVHNIRHMALRYFNAAGADAQAQIGELHEPESHIIPLAIQTALGLRARFEIFGTDYQSPDGTAIRDYIHVEDLADAHVRAMHALQTGAPSSVLNLGTGTGHSVREVLAAVRLAAGREFPIVERGRRPGDPEVLIADARRAQDILQWLPRSSTLENIVSSAWRWHARSGATN